MKLRRYTVRVPEEVGQALEANATELGTTPEDLLELLIPRGWLAVMQARNRERHGGGFDAWLADDGAQLPDAA